MPDFHSCPGCWLVQVPKTRLACPNCWRRLPRELKHKLTDAWIALKRKPVSGKLQYTHLEMVSQCIQWYVENPVQKTSESSRKVT